LNAKYQQMIIDLDQDLSTVTTHLRDETAMAASLAVRLKEMELKRDADIAALEMKMAVDFKALRSEMEILRYFSYLETLFSKCNDLFVMGFCLSH
jgi:hypothetical protein